MNHIDYSDFYTKQEDQVAYSYDIVNPVIRKVLDFYLRMPFCESGYCIQCADGKYSDVYTHNELDYYHRFGIYFLREGYIPDNPQITRILTVSPEVLQSLENFQCWIDSNKKELSNAVIVLEMGKTEQEIWFEQIKDSDQILKLLSEYEVVNDYIPKGNIDAVIESANHKYEKACGSSLPLFDCYDVFCKYPCITNSIEMNFRNIVKIADELEVFAKKKVLFTIRSFKYKEQSLVYLYCAVAVYLEIKCGARFVIPESIYGVYDAIYHNICDRRYLYCHEYLDSLKFLKPVYYYYPSESKFGCFVCPYHNGNNLIAQFISAPKSDPSNISFHNAKLVNMNIIDLTTVYQLHTCDYALGFRELERLNADIKDFCEVIYDSVPVIDCSNFFMYKENGEIYYAVLQKISGTVSTKCQPTAKGFIAINRDFSASELENMRDIRDMTNLNLERALPKLGYEGNVSDCFFQDSPKIKRILFSSVQGKSMVLTDSVIPFDDYGLIDKTAIRFRSTISEDFLDFIPIAGLRKYFLSFFGGPHPQSNINLNISNSLWEA